VIRRSPSRFPIPYELDQISLQQASTTATFLEFTNAIFTIIAAFNFSSIRSSHHASISRIHITTSLTMSSFLSLSPELRLMVYQFLWDDAEASGKRIFWIRKTGTRHPSISPCLALGYRRRMDGPWYCPLLPAEYVVMDHVDFGALFQLGKASKCILGEIIPLFSPRLVLYIRGCPTVARSFLRKQFKRRYASQ